MSKENQSHVVALIIEAADFAAFKNRNLRGTHRRLDRIFDKAYALRP